MPSSPRERGFALVVVCAIVAIAVATVFTTALARIAGGSTRAKATDRALASAREALIAYATSRPIDPVVGPGYLPCPDLDDDGWAESTCGSMTGETGQWQRLGRLPWKTLGLPDLRDGHGERLWYAVSSKHKGLLNCTVSAACLDMGPETALGTITVRDSSGTVMHDGTLADPYEPSAGGAVAIVLAPGPALERWAGVGSAPALQDRSCEGGRCNASGHCLTHPPTLTPKCDPRNYLDRSPGPAYADEDNAGFIDRNDLPGRLGNRDGFILGPVAGPDGHIWVNDRVAVISYDDLMPRVMRRVADEVAACLRAFGAGPANRGRLPWAAPLCRASDPEASLRFADAPGVYFGRVPDTPFTAAQQDGGASLSPLWVQGRETCAIADSAGVTAGASGLSWWTSWKRHVFYALSPAFGPDAPTLPACDRLTCLASAEHAEAGIAARQSFAVLVAGAPLRRGAIRQVRGSPADLDARNWLEGVNAGLRLLNPNPAAPQCPAEAVAGAGSRREDALRVSTTRTFDRNDVVVTHSAERAR